MKKEEIDQELHKIILDVMYGPVQRKLPLDVKLGDYTYTISYIPLSGFRVTSNIPEFPLNVKDMERKKLGCTVIQL